MLAGHFICQNTGAHITFTWSCFFATWFILIMYIDGSTELLTMDEPR